MGLTADDSETRFGSLCKQRRINTQLVVISALPPLPPRPGAQDPALQCYSWVSVCLWLVRLFVVVLILYAASFDNDSDLFLKASMGTQLLFFFLSLEVVHLE